MPVVRPGHGQPEIGEAALPLQLGVVRANLERDVMSPADAGAPVRDTGPLEERDRRAGSALLVAEVEVIRARVVEVDRLLHEAQPEHGRVEVDGPLRVQRADGDVVQSFYGHRPAPSRFSVSRMTRGRRPAAA